MADPGWDVLGIGNAAVDELISLDYYPEPDSKQQIRQISRQGGGLVATALVAAARQGARAAFCSRFGPDELSAFTLADLAQEGVDCSPSSHAPDGRPYHAYILVEGQGHTRTILYERGVVEPQLETITPELVGRARVLFIDHHAPLAARRAAQIAFEHGIPVVADLESDRVPYLGELIALSGHLILSARFAGRLTGLREPAEITTALAEPNRPCCAITAGEAGCWYSLWGGPVAHCPAFRVAVVDTTGCGDVFHGVYAAALARGEAPPQAIRLASAAAALKATRLGGRAGIPDLETTRRFSASRG